MIGCKKYAEEILSNIAEQVSQKKVYGCLAVISVGCNPASESYIKGKKADCERVGFDFVEYHYQVEENPLSNVGLIGEIIGLIEQLNQDDAVTGIIVQLPLPDELSQYTNMIISTVDPSKDVDGFVHKSQFSPCTPEGAIYVLRKLLGDLDNKNIVIIGRGKLVGRPLVQMLINENANVTCLHSHTSKENIYNLTVFADAIVTAVGVPQIWGTTSFGMANKDIPIIDVGCNRDENGKLCGDVVRDSFENQTSVPGGMGLMTRAMLVEHTKRECSSLL